MRREDIWDFRGPTKASSGIRGILIGPVKDEQVKLVSLFCEMFLKQW